MDAEKTENVTVDNSEEAGCENGKGGPVAAAGSYRWSVHLIRTVPVWKTAVFFVVLAGAVAFSYYAFQNWIIAVVFAVVLFVSFADYIFPLAYEIGPGGVSVTGFFPHRRRMEWANVRRCVANDRGVLCSPFGKTSRLDGIRGVFLRFRPGGRFGPGNRDEVIANVRKFRDAANAL